MPEYNKEEVDRLVKACNECIEGINRLAVMLFEVVNGEREPPDTVGIGKAQGVCEWAGVALEPFERDPNAPPKPTEPAF